ncbi:hypothetical protein [Lihuaxuella thermophila]|uniref:hypothetical protein n=1 Tax=Lihuaxuella thermophila TaxID=1173111 RepID=UPI0011146955|nr:hypothetical protein [Lihuaxuella thermophila]
MQHKNWKTLKEPIMPTRPVRIIRHQDNNPYRLTNNPAHSGMEHAGSDCEGVLVWQLIHFMGGNTYIQTIIVRIRWC